MDPRDGPLSTDGSPGESEAPAGEAPPGRVSLPVLESDTEVTTLLEHLDAVERDLADVERALARLEDGTYGRCEVCGAALDEAAIEQHPSIRFCPSHLPMAIE